MSKYLQPEKYVQFSRRVLAAGLRHTPIIGKHYRQRRCIERVTDACNLISANHKYIGSHAFNKAIKGRLLRLGINFSELPAHQQGGLYSLFADQLLQPGDYDELKQQMIEAPVDLLPCRQWLNLHEMCCFRGRYTIGQIFREKARQLAIKPLDGREFEPPISWESTIGAAIEGGECRRSDQLDKLLARAGITGEVVSKWHLYLAVLNGHDISREWLDQFEESDFADYLVGKSIAIVGPAPTAALDAEQIDSHNLVVRLNHSYEGKGTDPQHKGLRTDVTCFNSEQAKSLMQKRNGVLPGEVTWGCFKSPGLISHITDENKNKNARNLITFYQPQFHGSFNMVPIVALDLALFAANSLKIYHTDLMLTINRQKGYYPESFNRPSDDVASMQKIFRHTSIAHDPVQQYRTLNNLWRNEKITGDARFVEVMQMGLSTYILELERVYATPHTCS